MRLNCIVVGGASGLSAAGGGDFYYEDNCFLIGSILEGLQKSTDFMARLLECNTHSRPERNTGDMWRPS